MLAQGDPEERGEEVCRRSTARLRSTFRIRRMPGMTCADGRVLEDEAKGQFRQIHALWHRERFETLDARERLLQAVRREIHIPVVAARASSIPRPSVPVRLPSSNGTRAMTAMP